MGTQKDWSDKYNSKAKASHRGDDGEIVIPAGVTDTEAYLLYVQLHEQLMTDPDAIYQTSDPDLEINMLGNVAWVKKKITHLGSAEKRRIDRILTRIKKLKGQVSATKRKAFAADKDSTELKKFNKDGTSTGVGVLASRQMELIEMFGRFFTLPEVHKVVTADWGYSVSLTSLGKYRMKFIDKIKERQEEFKRDYSDVRLGYKRSRLDELTYLYSDRKSIYSSSKSREDSKELRATLEQIRKEVEGDVLTIDGDLKIKHSHQVELQIHSELLNGMPLKSLIVARVAAKLGRDPIILQNRLMTSYYAKFNGFQKADNDLMSDEITYPSSLIYDFEDLRKRHDASAIQDAQIVEESGVTVSQSESDKLNDIKAALMKRMMEQRNINIKTAAKYEGGSVGGEENNG